MNMTDDAVAVSHLRSDTDTAVASSTDTESLPFARDFAPAAMYLTDRMPVRTVRSGSGRNVLKTMRFKNDPTSLSSNSRLSCLALCSGIRASAVSFSNEARESAFMTSLRSPV